jgi:hypothetical protein
MHVQLLYFCGTVLHWGRQDTLNAPWTEVMKLMLLHEKTTSEAKKEIERRR